MTEFTRGVVSSVVLIIVVMIAPFYRIKKTVNS